jgi:20S proteasome alpha/beta subunit
VGVKCKDAVILGVEKKTVAKLQESRTVKKVVMLDAHLCMTFAGAPLLLPPSPN